MTINHILSPLDFSETSAHAIELATHIAGWYESRITALHVVTPLVTPYPGLPAVDPRTDPLLGEPGRRRMCGEILDAFREARAAGTSVDAMVNVGQPAREILDCAARLPADLIVMGTHGRRGIRRIALGSDAEQVLRTSPVPLLLVRSAPE